MVLWQVANIVEACCTFLERQLDPTNAIGIAAFAEQHGCHDLVFKANRYIEQHFTQVSFMLTLNIVRVHPV